MYYLDIIPAIYFLIDHYLFAQDMIYASVYYYLTNSLKNSKVDNKNEQIYEKLYIID